MSELHKALEALGPRDFSDIPLEELPTFLNESFAAASEIVNSVPRGGEGNSNGSAKSGNTPPSLAHSASDMVSVHNLAPPVDVASQANAKCWGKPLRLGAKENPLGLSLYKMAAHDRHGAWFARRSIHRGMSFDKWKSAMKHEFVESMGVVGGPGAGSIRGIGAERRVERKIVQGIGALEVWHLSAQFPGPTAPRDFVVCLLSSDTTKDAEKSENHADDHYMVVSIPVDHPDAPLRDGMVRGQYESVEIIRRVKDWDQRWKSTDQLQLIDHHGRDRAHTIGFSESRGFTAKGEGIDLPEGEENADNSSDLVEWIMITRSDPGGGIPRFMVERGTPGSIASDAVKFLDWATSKENIPMETDNIEELTTPLEERLSISRTKSRSDDSTFEPSKPTDTGVISSLTSVVRDGLDRYAPGVQESISNMITGHNQRVMDDDSDDDSDYSSLDSFASAEQFTTAEEHPPTFADADHLRPPDGEASSISSLTSAKTSDSNLDSKLAKLEEKKKSLDTEYDKATKREEAKAQEALSKEAKEAAKAKERLERDRKKREAKYAKEMKKIEEKRQREERKAEERRQKALEGDTLSQTKRERDQAKRMAEVLKQENEILRERIGDLQKENTMIVQRVSKLSGGRELLREIKTLVASPNSSKSNIHVNVPGQVDTGNGVGAKEQARARSTSPAATNRSSGSSINSGSKESGKGVTTAAN